MLRTILYKGYAFKRNGFLEEVVKARTFTLHQFSLQFIAKANKKGQKDVPFEGSVIHIGITNELNVGRIAEYFNQIMLRNHLFITY